MKSHQLSLKDDFANTLSVEKLKWLNVVILRCLLHSNALFDLLAGEVDESLLSISIQVAVCQCLYLYAWVCVGVCVCVFVCARVCVNRFFWNLHTNSRTFPDILCNDIIIRLCYVFMYALHSNQILLRSLFPKKPSNYKKQNFNEPLFFYQFIHAYNLIKRLL